VTSLHSVGQPPELTGQDFAAMDAAPQFRELRRRLRAFVFPMTAFFLAWYLAYVLLATYAPGFMSTPAIGNINIGILLGLAQFVTTFVITGLYVRFANRELDPRAEAIRQQLVLGKAGPPGRGAAAAKPASAKEAQR